MRVCSWTRNRMQTRAERRGLREQVGQVERSGVGLNSNPPRRTTGRKHGRGDEVVSN